MTDAPSLPRSGPQLPLSERLRRIYPELTETERRAADLLMAAPAMLLLHTGREIAARARVSPASFSRLIRRLGYADFAEARHAERSRRASGSPFQLFDSGQPGAGGPLQHAFEQDRRLLTGSSAMLDAQAVVEVIAALAGTRCLWFAGFRNNRFLADYARALFTTIRPGAHALSVPGQTVGERIANIAPGDVVVAFGMRRRVGFFGPMLGALAEVGAQVVLVTDQSLRPGAPGARWTLVCPVETAQAFDSYVVPIALIRLLALETLQRLGPDTGGRLRRIDDALARLGELE
jgi:DNA-binding MurR/RpiR family transcriptional regulator